MKNEQTHMRLTLLSIRDWNGFQLAMREGLQHPAGLQDAKRRVDR